MSTDSDDTAGDAAFEPLGLADVDWGDDVLELSEHLARLWRVAGDAEMSVGQMHNVRAGLFGYGRAAPKD